GIGLFVRDPADRLPTVTAINIPDGVDGAKVSSRLLHEFSIEISGGLGELKGKIWRVGLMGYSSQRGNVLLFLGALEKILLDQGMKLPAGAGIAAAASTFVGAAPVATGQGR
ncbi:MAG: alanine--glyoxylate aminotransferase family protein, partial [Acidobacteriia bacterium]|nr:alanine--glyoxylate aminotransferase family protein [Terriglobia bacterium]